jgi:hypothetical protein
MAFRDLLAVADRAVQKHLGGTVLYTPTNGGGVEVAGVFEAGHVRADAGQAGLTTVGPAAFVRLEDLPSDPEVDEGATVSVDGVEYRIHEPAKDGQGGVTLYLHRK